MKRRSNVIVSNVLCKQVQGYSQISPASMEDMDALNDDFVANQILPNGFISKEVEKCEDNSSTRMDIVWYFLAGTKHADGREWFPRLSKVAEIVLSIPHSNAGEERIFSMVRKNKTDLRSSPNPDVTLASLIITKFVAVL